MAIRRVKGLSPKPPRKAPNLRETHRSHNCATCTYVSVPMVDRTKYVSLSERPHKCTLGHRVDVILKYANTTVCDYFEVDPTLKDLIS